MDTLDVEIFLVLSFIVSVMESDLLSCRGIFDKNAFECVGTILVSSRHKYELERYFWWSSMSHVWITFAIVWHMGHPFRFSIWNFGVFVGKRSRRIIIFTQYVRDIDVRLQRFLYQNCPDQLSLIFLDHYFESHHDLHKLLFHIV